MQQHHSLALRQNSLLPPIRQQEQQIAGLDGQVNERFTFEERISIRFSPYYDIQVVLTSHQFDLEIDRPAHALLR